MQRLKGCLLVTVGGYLGCGILTATTYGLLIDSSDSLFLLGLVAAWPIMWAIAFVVALAALAA